MPRIPRVWLGASVCVSLTAAASSLVWAADHDEADTSSFSDDAADIGDLYAFHQDGRLSLILTFDGYLTLVDSMSAGYDADVIYGFHIDTDGDNLADHDIWARFGQDDAGEWGLQIEGIPGESAAAVGAVESVTTTAAGAQMFAGLRDDPFFFDLQGYQDTLMTGTLSFDPNRDFVAFKNTMAIALEFDAAGLGSQQLAVWATSGRRG